MKGEIKLTAKILELLGEGFALGMTRNRSQKRALHEKCDEVWFTIDHKQLYKTLERFKMRGLIETIKMANGMEQIRLSGFGKAQRLKKKLDALEIESKKKWDKKWRIVMFDVPESRKTIRDALRRKLKQLGFAEFQKSVFVFPYPCDDAINFVINFFDIAENVYMLESTIYPDSNLRKRFKL